MSITDREPVALAGAVIGVLALIPGGLGVFDIWHPTDDQIAWLSLFFTGVIGILTTWARGKAWAPTTVATTRTEDAEKVVSALDQRNEANKLALEAMAVAAAAHSGPVAVGSHAPVGPVGGRDPNSEGNT